MPLLVATMATGILTAVVTTLVWAAVVVIFCVYWTPYALYLMNFWLLHFVLAGLSFSSGIMGGRGSVVMRVRVLDVMIVLISILAMASAACVFIWGWFNWWDCILDKSLDPFQTYICDNGQWIMTAIYWGCIPAVVRALVNLVGFGLDFVMISTPHAPHPPTPIGAAKAFAGL